MNPFGRFVVGLATLGPIGSLPAPGTWGSVAGVAFYAVVFDRFNTATRWSSFALLLALAVFVAIVTCGLAEVLLKRKDPGCVIIDEFVAMPIVFIGFRSVLQHPNHWWVWYLAGFGLFRFFDILKPLGISRLQSLKGGLGVVVDDLAAAAYACVTLHLVRLVCDLTR